MLIELALSAAFLAAGTTTALYRRSELGRLRRVVRRALRRVRRGLRETRSAVAAAGSGLEQAAGGYSEARRAERLRETSIEDLRKAGVRNVRWSALEEAGIRSLADLGRASPASLESIPGVGPATAKAVSQGGQERIARLAEEPVELPPPDSWPREATRHFARAAWFVLQAREHLAEVVERLERECRDLEEVWARARTRTRARDWALRRVQGEALEELRTAGEGARARARELEASGLLDRHAEVLAAAPNDLDLGTDFQARYPDYAALFENALHAASPVREAVDAGAAPALRGPHRGLPADVARRIEAHPLDTRGLTVTLRRYQQFGAKYVLAQGRTVLGDEMGLGKTIQALAAVVHLRNAEGATHFLVVCPASIVRNWAREIDERTALPAFLLLGAQREALVEEWIAAGGIAVTSYSTLRSLSLVRRLQEGSVRVGLCVVDEAHYAKNPAAARSRAVEDVARVSERICLMSGTPLENRLEEFRHLISIVSPPTADLLTLEETGFARISSIVAPVYLRRNQPDVLRELPERIEMEEWLDLSSGDLGAYRRAVADRNYMAMRRTATIGDGSARSAKVARLAELLEEYRASERKVVVFSFFLDVLEVLAEEFPALGTLRGSVAPARRHELVDGFQGAEGFQLLLSQIEAGGVGINLQAASVVVLMEPQWKPSTETQAIARAHRMGQIRHVVVHRMLARECVDERMVELLRRKQALFDQNVRDSELKEASAEATERGFAEAVIDEELARLELSGP